MTLEYKQTLTELDLIISNMNAIYYEKLPAKLKEFIKENKDMNYIPNITKGIPINEQPLKKETKVLLSVFYRKYWYESRIQNTSRNTIENQYQIQSDLNSHNTEQTSLIKTSTKWYKILFDRILSFFKTKKKI